MKDTIRIITEVGKEIEVEIVAFFTLKSNRKDYLIYTEHTVDENGNIEIYTSEVKEGKKGELILVGVENDDVWNEIKQVMVNLARGE